MEYSLLSKKMLMLVVIITLLFSGSYFIVNHFNNKTKVAFCSSTDGVITYLRINNKIDVIFYPDMKKMNTTLNCLGKYMPFYDRKMEFIIINTINPTILRELKTYYNLETIIIHTKPFNINEEIDKYSDKIVYLEENREVEFKIRSTTIELIKKNKNVVSRYTEGNFIMSVLYESNKVEDNFDSNMLVIQKKDVTLSKLNRYIFNTTTKTVVVNSKNITNVKNNKFTILNIMKDTVKEIVIEDYLQMNIN